MSLSKAAKRGIGAFNASCNPLYRSKWIDLDTKVDAFVTAYLELQEKELDDQINNQVGEVAGEQVS